MARCRLGNRRRPSASDGSLDSAAVNPARRLVPVDRRHLSYRVGRPDSDDHVPEEYDYGGGGFYTTRGQRRGAGAGLSSLLRGRSRGVADNETTGGRGGAGPGGFKKC